MTENRHYLQIFRCNDYFKPYDCVGDKFVVCNNEAIKHNLSGLMIFCEKHMKMFEIHNDPVIITFKEKIDESRSTAVF